MGKRKKNNGWLYYTTLRYLPFVMGSMDSPNMGIPIKKQTKIMESHRVRVKHLWLNQPGTQKDGMKNLVWFGSRSRIWWLKWPPETGKDGRNQQNHFFQGKLAVSFEECSFLGFKRLNN